VLTDVGTTKEEQSMKLPSPGAPPHQAAARPHVGLQAQQCANHWNSEAAEHLATDPDPTHKQPAAAKLAKEITSSGQNPHAPNGTNYPPTTAHARGACCDHAAVLLMEQLCRQFSSFCS